MNNNGETPFDLIKRCKGNMHRADQEKEVEKIIKLLRAHGAKTGEELKASSVKSQGSGVDKE